MLGMISFGIEDEGHKTGPDPKQYQSLLGAILSKSVISGRRCSPRVCVLWLLNPN